MGTEREGLLQRPGARRDGGETWWNRTEVSEEIRRRAVEDAERAFEKVREQLERLVEEVKRETWAEREGRGGKVGTKSTRGA